MHNYSCGSVDTPKLSWSRVIAWIWVIADAGQSRLNASLDSSSV